MVVSSASPARAAPPTIGIAGATATSALASTLRPFELVQLARLRRDLRLHARQVSRKRNVRHRVRLLPRSGLDSDLQGVLELVARGDALHDPGRSDLGHLRENVKEDGAPFEHVVRVRNEVAR